MPAWCDSAGPTKRTHPPCHQVHAPGPEAPEACRQSLPRSVGPASHRVPRLRSYHHWVVILPHQASGSGCRRRSSSGPEAASRQRESIRIQHITSACKGLTRSFGLAARSTPDHDSAQLTCASLSSQSGTWWSLKNRPSANNTGVPGFWTKKILCAWTLGESDAPPVPARTLGELCRTTKRRRKCWALSSTVSGCVCNFRGPPAVVETGEA